jgi:hypothetical protein
LAARELFACLTAFFALAPACRATAVATRLSAFAAFPAREARVEGAAAAALGFAFAFDFTGFRTDFAITLSSAGRSPGIV